MSASAGSATETPQITTDMAAQFICDQLRASGAAIIIRDENNLFRLMSSGFSHADMNEAFCLGIHMNMNTHDKRVLAGDAGKASQETAVKLALADVGGRA